MARMNVKEINQTYKKLFDNVYYTLVDLVLESKVKSEYVDECKALRLPDNGNYNDFVELVFINGELTLIDEDGFKIPANHFWGIRDMIDVINEFKN